MTKKAYIAPALVSVDIIEEGLIAQSPSSISMGSGQIDNVQNIGVREERWNGGGSVMDNEW